MMVVLAGILLKVELNTINKAKPTILFAMAMHAKQV
jgi:hypothetical protein